MTIRIVQGIVLSFFLLFSLLVLLFSTDQLPQTCCLRARVARPSGRTCIDDVELHFQPRATLSQKLVMAAEDGTVHHEDWEWESQRDNFTKYYKAENKTLKDSARCMHENHNFFATPRQWERRVKAWGLEKYTSRQDRLRQLEGRSIHEVARAGRRQRAYEASLLHPEQHLDDRNIRRFARRELRRPGSRSRSRSRSNSFGRSSRSVSPMPDGEASEEVIQEDVYGIDFSPLLQSGSMRDSSNAGPIQLQPIPTDHDSLNAQAHVMQLHNSITDETSGEVFLSFPQPETMQNDMQEIDTLDESQYSFADLDRRYSLEVMQPPQADLDLTKPVSCIGH